MLVKTSKDLPYEKNEIIEKIDENGVITYNIYDCNLLKKTVSKIKNPKEAEKKFFGIQYNYSIDNTPKIIEMTFEVAERNWFYYQLENHVKNEIVKKNNKNSSKNTVKNYFASILQKIRN